jgi:hypothetical protein
MKNENSNCFISNIYILLNNIHLIKLNYLFLALLFKKL